MALSDGRARWAAAAAAAKELNRIEDVAARYGVALRRSGHELVGLSPIKPEKTPSFYVDPRKQVFKCFASGEGGDVIALVQAVEGGTFADALKILGAETIDPATLERLRKQSEAKRVEIEREDRISKARKIELARGIWRAARPAEGTIVETYLRARRVDLDAIRELYGFTVPPTLRFHPGLDYEHDGVTHHGPAMVGGLYDYKSESLCGVHRTWLLADGSGKAKLPKPKKALGVLMGSLAPLTPERTNAVLGEGYETVLSVVGMLARERRPVAAWSANSLGNLAGAGLGRGRPHPQIEGKRLGSIIPDPERPGIVLPSCIRTLTLLADADGDIPSTEALMERAEAKYMAAGKEVSTAWPPVGQDFNDMVMAA